eukprot:gene9135-11192_t
MGTGLFNGYFASTLKRRESTLNIGIIDPEISISLSYGPTNTKNLLESTQIKTVDDTQIFYSMIFPEKKEFALDLYGSDIVKTTAMLKIDEQKESSFDKEMNPKLAITVFGGQVEIFSGYWDQNLMVFVIPFFIPKQSLNQYLHYFLVSSVPIYQLYFYSIFGPKSQVYIQSKVSDYLGPIVSDITINSPISQGSEIRIGWTIIIEDDIFGFSEGYIEVTSELDFNPFIITLNETNRLNGNSTKGEYLATFGISPTNCVPQNYTISKIHLNQFNSPKIIYRDPLLKIGMLPEIISPCPVISTDITPPNMTIFSVYPFSVDVTSPDERLLSVTFEIEDLESGISDRHNPVVYIQSIMAEPIGFKSVPVTKSPSKYVYQSSILVPFQYGYGENITLSVYGIMDNALNSNGYSSFNLTTLWSNSSIVKRTTLENGLYLKNHSGITLKGGLITIEGYGFYFNQMDGQLKLSYKIEYPNNTVYTSDKFKVVTGFFLSFLIPSFGNQTFCKLQIFKGTKYSNTLLIQPDLHNYEQQKNLPSPYNTPTPSPTPSPTASPISCPGDCYGNGY